MRCAATKPRRPSGSPQIRRATPPKTTTTTATTKQNKLTKNNQASKQANKRQQQQRQQQNQQQIILTGIHTQAGKDAILNICFIPSELQLTQFGSGCL